MPRRLSIALVGGALILGVAALFLYLDLGVKAQMRVPSDAAAVSYAEYATTSPGTVATSSPRIIPILVYHIVRPSYPTDSASVRKFAVTPEIFDAQLTYLASAGYTVISFRDLEQAIVASSSLPAHPIILSFDDGWRDQFEYAFPLLVKHKVTATFFVFTNAIGHPAFLSLDMLKQLVAAGMTIGDHSKSHPYLTHIASTTVLRNEIIGSKQLLERDLGVPVTEFAYPFGAYDPAILAMVKAAGYRSARGDGWKNVPAATALFTLPALNVPTTLAAFERDFPNQNVSRPLTSKH